MNWKTLLMIILGWVAFVATMNIPEHLVESVKNERIRICVENLKTLSEIENCLRWKL